MKRIFASKKISVQTIDDAIDRISTIYKLSNDDIEDLREIMDKAYYDIADYGVEQIYELPEFLKYGLSIDEIVEIFLPQFNKEQMEEIAHWVKVCGISVLDHFTEHQSVDRIHAIGLGFSEDVDIVQYTSPELSDDEAQIILEHLLLDNRLKQKYGDYNMEHRFL